MEKSEESIKIQTVTTDSFSMDWFKFGRGDKTFVILPGVSVQSVMGSANVIADAYHLLAEEFTVYVFDRRKELPKTYSVYEMAEDTAAVFEALGLKHINLFGASQGGMMGMTIAIRHPELVEKLILGSTAARVSEERNQTIANWISLAEEKNAEGLYLAFGEALYSPSVFEQSRQLMVDAAKTVTDSELERFVIIANGLEGFDLTNDLGRIRCPVLVIGDRDDRVLGGAASEEIAAHLKDHPGCELYMYENYGHAAFDTAPDYKQRILSFCSRTEGSNLQVRPRRLSN